MLTKKFTIMAATLAVAGGAFFASTGTTHASAFLCPIVSDSVADVADEANGDNGVSTISPPAGTSFLPGNNQAGDNADSEAYNGNGGPEEGNTPGDGNSNFTPIWPT